MGPDQRRCSLKNSMPVVVQRLIFVLPSLVEVSPTSRIRARI